MHIPSYPKVFNLGHPSAASVFFGEYVIEEKLDGSQLSFSVDEDGVLACRSKGAQIDIDNPPNLFQKAVDSVKFLAGEGKLTTNWIYRAEAFQSKRHNAINYGRAPEAGFIIFDVETNNGFFTGDMKRVAVRELGDVECVREFSWETGAPTEAMIDALLHQESMLGGAKVEGVVFKNYAQPSAFGPVAFPVTFVKYVNPSFRELNATRQKTEWSTANADVIEVLLSHFNREAIWKKAVQHLGDEGLLQGAPQDIGPLLKEINQDFEAENRAVVEEILYKKFRDKVMKGLTTGFPEWYKAELAKTVLETE